MTTFYITAKRNGDNYFPSTQQEPDRDHDPAFQFEYQKSKLAEFDRINHGPFEHPVSK